MAEKTIAPTRPELLITVVDRSKAGFYEDLISSYANMQIILDGHGTADAKALRYLGISETDKAVIVSVVKKNDLEQITTVLEQKFKTIRNGKGVSAAVPMDSVIGTLIYRFLIDERREYERE